MNRGRCQNSAAPFPSLPIPLLPRIWKFCSSTVEIPSASTRTQIPSCLEMGQTRGDPQNPQNPIWQPQERGKHPQRDGEIHGGKKSSGKKDFSCPPCPGKRGWEQLGSGAFVPTAAAGNERNRLGIVSWEFLTFPRHSNNHPENNNNNNNKTPPLPCLCLEK